MKVCYGQLLVHQTKMKSKFSFSGCFLGFLHILFVQKYGLLIGCVLIIVFRLSILVKLPNVLKVMTETNQKK